MLYFVLALVLITLAAATYFIATRKKYLCAEEAKEFCKLIDKTSKLDPNHSLMESHKIFVGSTEKITKKKKTAAKTLEQICKRLKSDKDMWRFHRMRNKAAHEMGFKVSSAEAQEARKVFKSVIKQLSN